MCRSNPPPSLQGAFPSRVIPKSVLQLGAEADEVVGGGARGENSFFSLRTEECSQCDRCMYVGNLSSCLGGIRNALRATSRVNKV